MEDCKRQHGEFKGTKIQLKPWHSQYMTVLDWLILIDRDWSTINHYHHLHIPLVTKREIVSRSCQVTSHFRQRPVEEAGCHLCGKCWLFFPQSKNPRNKKLVAQKKKGVSKNRGKTPKMDSEKNLWKTLWTNGWFGGPKTTPSFGSTPISRRLSSLYLAGA